MSRHLVGALESNHGFRVADIEEKVRPVARVSFVVIGKAWLAGSGVRHAIFTFDVVGAAVRPLRVDTELVETPGRADRGQISFLVATIHGPVVVAVVVYVPLAIIQEAVLAFLQRHGSIGALKVVITEVRMCICLHAIRFWASRYVQQYPGRHCRNGAQR